MSIRNNVYEGPLVQEIKKSQELSRDLNIPLADHNERFERGQRRSLKEILLI